jgi:hypothetical protein
MSNYYAYRDIEVNKDLSAFNKRPLMRLGVIRHINVIRELSDSRLAIPLIPLTPSSTITLTPLVIA